MSGYLGNLSDKQQEKLSKFRESLKDVLQAKHDERDLLRFLRARRFDLKRAEQMFRKDVEWRAEMKIDTIVDWYTPPEVLRKHLAGGMSGFDKEQHVIFIADLGSMDPRGIMFSAKESDILTTLIFILEDLIKKEREMAMEKFGKVIDGALVIIDLEKMGIHHLWKPGIDLFTKALMIMEQHYPEAIHQLLIVKAPRIFPIGFTLVKPFLREDTRNKIVLMGSNWKDELLKRADPDQLPVFWGGTKTDPDGNPKCESSIMPAGKVPKSYYLKGRTLQHKLTDHEIGRGASLEIKYRVTTPECVFRYEFETSSGSGDIKFGVDRVDDKGKRTPIMKTEKFNSHQVPQDGELMIQGEGTYLARFENDSWTKAKKLSFWVEMLESSEAEPEFQEMGDEFTKINLKD